MAPPNQANVRVDDFEIYLNGRRAPDSLTTSITRCTVDYELNLPAMFTFEFHLLDFFNGAFRGVDLQLLKPGTKVSVLMGVYDARKMMSGTIAGIEPSFGEKSSVTVRGYDDLFLFQFGKKTRTFQAIKDSEVAIRIARELGIRARAEATQITYPYLCQQNQTDYEFLLSRAQRNNYEMLFEDNEFTFRKSAEGLTPGLPLTYGVELQRFSARLKVLTEGSRVEVRGWDPKSKKAISAFADRTSPALKMRGRETGSDLSRRAFRSSPMALDDMPVLSTADAKNLAQSEYDLLLNEFIEAEGVCIGKPEIRNGINIEVKGLGSRFSGLYYVTSSIHTFDVGRGYVTIFNARRTGI